MVTMGNRILVLPCALLLVLFAGCSGPTASVSERPSTSPGMPRPSTMSSEGPTGVIAFHADPGGNSGLYVTNADGTGVRLVTSSLAGYPFARWSPDGSKLAFLSGRFGIGRLMVVNLDGSDLRTLGDAQVTSAVAWSPDGQRLLYEDADQGGVWVIGADDIGARQVRATGHPTEWSSDGKWIAFFDGPEGASQIYRIPADGGQAEALTQDGDDVSPTWSPDGSQIAFTSSRDGNLEIYVVSADGSNLRRLTDDPAPDDEARWSPDSSQLVYVS